MHCVEFDAFNRGRRDIALRIPKIISTMCRFDMYWTLVLHSVW